MISLNFRRLNKDACAFVPKLSLRILIFFQAGFKFCWNIDTGDYYVVDSEPLKEISKESGGVWHPARYQSYETFLRH
jgi:hypothetical protein